MKVFTCVLAVVLATTSLGVCSANSFRRRAYGQNPWVSNGMGGHMYNPNAGVNSYSFSNPSSGVNSNSFSRSFRRLRRKSIAEE